MKKITKIILAVTLLFTVGLYAQEKCNFICHNGSVVKAFGDGATEAHLLHHPNDVFLGTCDTYQGQEGDSCEVLGLKDLDISKPIESGLKYVVFDLLGRERFTGTTSEYFLRDFPTKEVFYLKIEGYKVKSFIK